jgi:hypothetical protein
MNGLYSIHVDLLDGRSGRGSGIILFRDGQIRGGDTYLFYVGHYVVRGERFSGEVVINQHTRSVAVQPLFGGSSEVSIGVSGSFAGDAAVMNGTALVGKSSLIFRATLRRFADAG